MRDSIAILFFWILVTQTIFAEKITAYDVDIKIKQSGELEIIEKITYDFEQVSRHGIFRDIPAKIKIDGIKKEIGLNNFIVMQDHQQVDFVKSTEISNKAGKIIRLKIGNPSLSITGSHLYTIGYKVKMGVVPASKEREMDAVRWNFIGTGWKIPISNITANVFLPTSLSKQNCNVSTYTGEFGSIHSTAETQWITPNQLRIDVASLYSHEGATVEIAFPAYTLDQHGATNMQRTIGNAF